MKLFRIATLLSLSFATAGAVEAPHRPANPLSATGFWVGQSEPDRSCWSTRIEFSSVPAEESRYSVKAEVQLEPFFPGSIPNANLVAEWKFPDGRKQQQTVRADAHGRGVFKIAGPVGEYHFSLRQVQGNGLRFDPKKSVLEGKFATVMPGPRFRLR